MMESFSNLLTTEAKIHGLFGLLSSLSFLEEICLAFQIHQPLKKKQIWENILKQQTTSFYGF